MKFHIQTDGGAAILGWLVPDNPLSTSRVNVVVDGRTAASVSATLTLPDIKGWGWHSTGQCGFVVDEAAVPGLAEIRRLELLDADTNVLIYRRPLSDDLVQSRLITLNPSILEPHNVQNALFKRFQMSYFRIENLSEEIFYFANDIKYTESVYLSGGIFYTRHEGNLYKRDFIASICVGDAFVELARRILWLRERAGLAASPEQGWRVSKLQAPIAFASALSLDNPAALKKAFRGLDQPTWNFLSNPLTRVLACVIADQRIEASHPSQALAALSRFHVVGHEDFWDAYVATLLGRLGLPPEPIEREPTSAETMALAETLRRTGTARALVDYDATLSDAVRGVVAAQWGEG